jgi:phage-related protein
VVNYFSQLPGKLGTTLTNTVTKVVSWGSDMLSKAKTGMQNVVTGIVNTFTDLPSKMTTIGKNIINGIISGISSMVSSLYDSITNALSGLVDKAKSALGIASPSKVLAAEVGKWIPAGMAVGIEENTQTAARAMVNMAKRAVGAANTELAGSSLNAPGVNGAGAAGSGSQAGGATYVFNQYNNSPKALSRAEIYSNTKNALRFATGNA